MHRILLSVLFLSSSAFAAGLTLSKPFTLAANGDFSLTVNNGMSDTELHGNLRVDSAEHTASQGRITAYVRAYDSDHVISVALIQEDDGQGYLYILQRQNADYVAVNSQPILARSVHMVLNLDEIIEHSREVGYKSDESSVLAMVHYFQKNPGKELSVYFRQFETGNIQAPAPKVAQTQMPTAPVPARVANEALEEPQNLHPADNSYAAQIQRLRQQQAAQAEAIARAQVQYQQKYAYRPEGYVGYPARQPVRRPAPPPGYYYSTPAPIPPPPLAGAANVLNRLFGGY